MKRILKGLIGSMLALTCALSTSAQVLVTSSFGTSGTYPTLNAAFADINSGAHQGAIDILITGNTTEPSPPTSLVGSGVGSASYSSIHISPTGGSWTVHSSATPFAYRGIIELFGAQHVTIDGDPSGTGIRNLTFEVARSSNVSTSAIRLGATDTAHGAAYDTIRNCNIIGARDSARSSVANYGIIVSGNSTTSTLSPVAYHCDYDAFINNTFSRSYYSLYFQGPSPINRGSNREVLIRKNYFGTDSAATSPLYAIYFKWFIPTGSAFGVIDSNDFRGQVTYSEYYGIYIEQSYGRLKVNDNKFHDLRANGVTAFYLFSSVANPFNRPSQPLEFFGNIMENCSGSRYFLFGDGPSPVTTYTRSVWHIYNNTLRNVSGGSGIVFNENVGMDSMICHHNTITNLGAATVGIAYSSSNGYIHDNIISGISNSGRSLVCGMYIHGALAYNNTISNITASPGVSLGSHHSSIAYLNGLPTIPTGIVAGTGADIYHNTIALNTDNRTGADTNAISAAIYSDYGNSTIKDNIIYNNQNSNRAYGFYNYGGTFTGDYNSYYIPYGNIGYASSVTAADLLHWQAGTGGQDMHSVTGPVPFHSITDLHIDTNSAYALPLFRTGTPLAAVPADIDGQSRNNPPCIGADEFTAVTVVIDSVWPGDADDNNLADHTDLLPIGLGYDSTGPMRTGASIVWVAQEAADWGHTFPVYAPTVDFKHADCNGDGIINAADTTAISANFGLTHAKTADGPGPWRSGTPGLKISFSQDTVHAGDTLITSFILGDSLLPAAGISGFAFTYHYDPIVVDSTMISFSFGSSWLGGSTDAISLSRNFPSTGTLKAAITRIDHTNRSGYGVLGNMISRINTDNINGKDLAYHTNHCYISDIITIDAAGNRITINAGQDSNQVAYTPTGIHDVAATAISLYPTPAKDKIRIVSESDMQLISIYDIPGQLVATTPSGKKMETIDVSDLANGVYVVSVNTRTDRRELKLIISRK